MQQINNNTIKQTTAAAAIGLSKPPLSLIKQMQQTSEKATPKHGPTSSNVNNYFGGLKASFHRKTLSGVPPTSQKQNFLSLAQANTSLQGNGPAGPRMSIPGPIISTNKPMQIQLQEFKCESKSGGRLETLNSQRTITKTEVQDISQSVQLQHPAMYRP